MSYDTRVQDYSVIISVYNIEDVSKKKSRWGEDLTPKSPPRIRHWYRVECIT